MSRDDKPDSDKLAKMFGASHSADPEANDRQWVEEQLEPVAGDKIIGTLDDAEVDRFVQMSLLEIEHDEMQHTLRKRITEAQIRAQSEANDWNQFVRLMGQHKLFSNDAEAEDSWRLTFEYQYQWFAFWRDTRAKHSAWGDNLSIRHGWVIVSTGKKYRS
jgi:hypothetical protein